MAAKPEARSQPTRGKRRRTPSLASQRHEETEPISTCIFYLDEEYRIIRANDAFGRATGHLPGELDGKKFFELFPNEDYEHLFCIVMNTGTPFFSESEPLELSRPGDEPGYWDVAVHPIYGVGGKAEQLVVTLSDVTDRVRSLRALEESKALFQHLFESSPDANLLLHMDGTIARLNRETERLFGYSRGELIGQPVETLVPQAARQEHIVERERYFQEQAIRRMGEGLYVHGLRKDGSEFPAEVALSPLNVENESQVLVVVRDITRQIQTESALQEKNEIVLLMRDVAAAANAARSVEEAVRYTLNRICAFLDWPLGQAYLVDPERGIHLADLYYARDPERYTVFREASRRIEYAPGRGLVGRVVLKESPEWLADIQQNPDFLRGDEARQAGLKTGLALPIRTGKEIAAVLEFFTDRVVLPIPAFLEILPHVVTQLGRVVERVRAEQELTHSEELFRAIFEGSAIGILMCDINGRVVLSNPAFEEMLGYAGMQLGGALMDWLLAPEDAARHRAQVRSLIAQTGQYPPHELRYLRRDGGLVWGRSVASVVYDTQSSPRYVITMVEEITQQKQMQSELAELKRRMLSNVEYERIRLAQDIHDGPIQDLYVVNMQLSGLAGGENDPAEVRDIMDEVENVIGSLRNTITELRPPTLVDFGLERAIRSHAERFGESNPSIRVHLNLEADRQLLSQPARLALFRNYQQAISNVVRHAAARNVWVRFWLQDNIATLEVEDDGQGFEFPERLVDLVRAGHLGLVGMLERVESMGGKLEVHTSPGKGTLVRTVIPFVADGE